MASRMLFPTITVEEAIDCREADSRFFIISNHQKGFQLIITKSSKVVSCKLDGHEIIVPSNRPHEAWAIGERPFKRMDSLPWNCHVRGAQLLLSTPTSSIVYELDLDNRLTCNARLKSVHLQHEATYFNLNNARSINGPSIDGHAILVKCNGNFNRISVKLTRLLSRHNQAIEPERLVGDIPFEFTRSLQVGGQLDEDSIICDAIYSIEATSQMDLLEVELRHGFRRLTVQMRTCESQQSVSSAGASTNVTTSSTATATATSSSSSSTLPSSSCSSSSSSSCTSSPFSARCPTTSNKSTMSPIPSSSTDVQAQLDGIRHMARTMSPPPPPAPDKQSVLGRMANGTRLASHATVILRIRVRVTPYGVCIMPIMMTNYCCTYFFV